MGFSYTGDPSASDTDAVRFEIQDTDPSAVLLQDEEVAWAILRESGTPANPSAVSLSESALLASAARCCESLSRRFAAQADQVVGDLEETYSKQSVTYAKRAQDLREKAQNLNDPYAGGLLEGEKIAANNDTNRVGPTFRKRQFDSPYVGRRWGFWP